MSEYEAQKIDSELYWIGWVSIGLMLIGVFLYKRHELFFKRFQFPCLFYRLTGYYCPGCGGTRAVKAFLSGDFIKSFLYHPLVSYLAFGGGAFMLTQTIQRLSKGKIRGIRFRVQYVYGMAIIIFIQFAVKNALIYFCSYYVT
ncbi:DUF2752 domain-containing protein [[Clostridium] polysaccharolyticum]|uniref:DUF2752 domain-containing protein n=1 Tax=[Clostridium] polysaccharolyticum TaxID=29364 RepID=UPI001FA90B88|nr:DUF2752 domain-containing protein [[Clostridium] polysaccharolyticum]